MIQVVVYKQYPVVSSIVRMKCIVSGFSNAVSYIKELTCYISDLIAILSALLMEQWRGGRGGGQSPPPPQ